MRNLKRYIGDITLIKSLMLVLYFHVTTKKIPSSNEEENKE